jgi:hypothetical protein
MNVHHSLQLKDEMENTVFLKARTKKHSAPHLNNKLKAVMICLRDAEVNCRRPGHHEGFEAIDDFTKGLEILKKEKIKNFIMQTTVYLNIVGLHSRSPNDLPPGDDIAEDDEWGTSEQVELPAHGSHIPLPPQMFAIDGDLVIEDQQKLDGSNTK